MTNNNPNTLRWRRATLGPCHKCDVTILSGTDRDRAALDAHVDPTPLTWAGELATRFTRNRQTYVCVAGALYHRLAPQHGPEGQYPVFPAHVCGDLVPSAWRAYPTPEPPVVTANTTTGVPF